MTHLPAYDEYAFLKRRAAQLIREGNYAAAFRLTRLIDDKQAERFRTRLKRHDRIAT